jgi:hypothetical protein
MFGSDIRHRTRYGAHGDYLFGLKDSALQRAIDALGTNCFSETYPAMQLEAWDQANGCNNPQQAKEDIGNNTCMCLSLLSPNVNPNMCLGLK